MNLGNEIIICGKKVNKNPKSKNIPMEISTFYNAAKSLIFRGQHKVSLVAKDPKTESTIMNGIKTGAYISAHY